MLSPVGFDPDHEPEIIPEVVDDAAWDDEEFDYSRSRKSIYEEHVARWFGMSEDRLKKYIELF